MRDADTFASFFRRVRAGDQDAAIELVREYRMKKLGIQRPPRRPR